MFRRNNNACASKCSRWFFFALCLVVFPLALVAIAILMPRHPALIWPLAFGLLLISLLSGLIAHRVRILEGEHRTMHESNSQLQKMAEIGRAASGIAHEINNPLAIIGAQAGVLADLVAENSGLSNLSEFKNRIDKIVAQVDRTREVAQLFLGFACDADPELGEVDVVAALEETVGFVEKDIETFRIQVVRRYCDVPVIRSNRAQMQLVFLNLIHNALDVIPRGGELRLSAECFEGAVIVKVADNGPGLAEKDLKRVFEPFFSTKIGKKHHAGLGLTICREMMRSLKGRISVASNPGKGTEFTLLFPLEGEP